MRLPKFQRFNLNNGLKVVLAERHDTPVVSFGLVLDGGMAADSTPAAVRPNPASPRWRSTCSTRAPTRVMRCASARNSRRSAPTRRRLLTRQFKHFLSASTLLDPALAIYADVIRNPSFPQHELERLKKQRIAAIQQEKSQPMGLALRVLPPLLYGPQHAYGLPLTGSGTETAVSALTVDDMQRFHRTGSGRMAQH